VAEKYRIQYAQEAANDVRALRAFDRTKVLEGIEQFLSHDPKAVSRSRIKEMNRPFWSQYRLRIDDFRVYYDVDESQQVVNVLRVLRKTTHSTPGAPP
jgi:mRNA-degrading endonuclease RelE of RelBE toxin-antitoxin system